MIFMSGYCLLLINYCSIYINKMETAFVIQIVQIGQYGTKLTNADFFSYWPTLIRQILVFWILSRFYMCIKDKIETFCLCRLMRQNGKEAKANKQMKLFHLKSKRNETRKSLKKSFMLKKKFKPVIVLNLLKCWTLWSERIKTHKTIFYC